MSLTSRSCLYRITQKWHSARYNYRTGYITVTFGFPGHLISATDLLLTHSPWKSSFGHLVLYRIPVSVPCCLHVKCLVCSSVPFMHTHLLSVSQGPDMSSSLQQARDKHDRVVFVQVDPLPRLDPSLSLFHSFRCQNHVEFPGEKLPLRLPQASA